MASIFGPTGREVYAAQQADRARAVQQAQQLWGGMSAEQVPLAVAGGAGQLFAQAGQQLGEGIGGGNLAMQKAQARKRAQTRLMASGVDASDPVAFSRAAAQFLSQEGLVDEAYEMARQAAEGERERAEVENQRSLAASRITAAENKRQFEAEQAMTKSEGKLDRESAERVAKIRTGARSAGRAPKTRRVASGQERKDAGTALKAELGDQYEALSKEEQEAIASDVATLTRDIIAQNPSMDAIEARLQAIGLLAQGITGEARLGIPALGGADYRRPELAGQGQPEPAASGREQLAPDGRPVSYEDEAYMYRWNPETGKRQRRAK